MTSSLRIFFIGGWSSYRALFGWLTPWILIPTFIITPVFQILFFAFVGRDAGVGDDTFFLIGNAIQIASSPCLFAMGDHDRGRAQRPDPGPHPGQPGASRARCSWAGRCPSSSTASSARSSPWRSVPSCSACRSRVSSLPFVTVVIAVAAYSCTGSGSGCGRSLAARPGVRDALQHHHGPADHLLRRQRGPVRAARRGWRRSGAISR